MQWLIQYIHRYCSYLDDISSIHNPRECNAVVARDSFQQRKMNMRFVIWNARNMYRAGSMSTVAREITDKQTPWPESVSELYRPRKRGAA
jgi:hypothetical protein